VNTVSDLEEILGSLCASEINASISWLWDGGIDLKLGDALNGYRAEGKVGTFGMARPSEVPHRLDPVSRKFGDS
jgi:hypothetical protein